MTSYTQGVKLSKKINDFGNFLNSSLMQRQEGAKNTSFPQKRA